MNHTAEVLHELFHPDKINFGAYGDTMHHLHFHLVPKYRDGFEWGGDWKDRKDYQHFEIPDEKIAECKWQLAAASAQTSTSFAG